MLQAAMEPDEPPLATSHRPAARPSIRSSRRESAQTSSPPAKRGTLRKISDPAHAGCYTGDVPSAGPQPPSIVDYAIGRTCPGSGLLRRHIRFAAALDTGQFISGDVHPLKAAAPI